jgi:DNA end-binding protein Ku
MSVVQLCRLGSNDNFRNENKEVFMRSGVWSGSISFGLLNIPVTLQSAQEDKEIHFSMMDEKDQSAIKFHRVSAETGKEVPYKRIVKAYEFKKGQFVTITNKDLQAANPKATKSIDIEDFVNLADIDPLLFDKPYYIVPKKGAEKGYFLLRDALVKSEKVAVAKIVLRTKQHLAAVMGRGDYLILEMMRFAHEVKEIHEVDYLKDTDTKVKYSSKELKMAQDLIAGMTSEWEPEKYRDTYYDDLMKRIKAKVKSGKGHELEESETPEAPEETTSNVVDLLPLLRQSLAVKKTKAPAKTERLTSHSTSHRKPQ